MFGVSVVVFNPNLALLGVVAVFFAVAMVSVARRGLRTVADETTVQLDGAHLRIDGRDRGRAVAAIAQAIGDQALDALAREHLDHADGVLAREQ